MPRLSGLRARTGLLEAHRGLLGRGLVINKSHAMSNEGNPFPGGTNALDEYLDVGVDNDENPEEMINLEEEHDNPMNWCKHGIHYRACDKHGT